MGGVLLEGLRRGRRRQPAAMVNIVRFRILCCVCVVRDVAAVTGRLCGCERKGVTDRPSRHFRHPPLPAIFALMLPAIFSTLLFRPAISLHFHRHPKTTIRRVSRTMGGDGGTIGSTRAYLRGAGKACHTADHPSSARERSKKAVSDDVVGRAKLILSTCAISGEVLHLSPGTAEDIVACPYGRLYKREKVLEVLLHRARCGGGGGNDDDRDNNTDAAAFASISHIRGMKDLYTVRFHVTTVTSGEGITQNNGKRNGAHYAPACPITGSDIGSGKVLSYVIVRSADAAKVKKNGSVDEDEVSRGPNVLSERAIKEMGVTGLQAEFGPFEEKDMILLAPPLTGGVFDKIKRKWEERVESDRVAKVSRLFEWI